ncbi:MAG: NADH:ubiquinone oxidoreductase subunit 2 [Zetaproteobacteria bacterium CG12_big_fil_rev_8_21_14_0_65_55_1124]|nr:MAG: NADH:ubiquinone oxidoreductase subunit 2 [Zetaproteobacteria bacterium CG1_02_55_237]PIS19289.1 MAG: NADH:ubiquinone oxidoreductase subunit 2 [Zetaproteobacteria bacterium CG08_land_8_20_14_0_20_55_17]PIW43534.1 MAG: NADH:ubiquinone oxidoreductase subunit 2 [Zetaproteobacteria bacterium CG12_big_fil_rev_8_21_14_0_65_55_1124]PIY54412.1 MAG: NADH:ubiquinone oxidoreductase subunit 2 [Zetaproteobacteria bacterium CG_4_10_14_0_8_um_filter_55_43]PIZ38997.1 MAG: NADH:ubiquinone oxidoreductase 
MTPVNFPLPNVVPLIPEMFVATMAMFILMLDLFLAKEKKVWGGYLAILTCVAAGGLTLMVGSAESVSAFYGFFVLDAFSSYAKLLIYAGTALAVILSLDYIKEEFGVGEYYTLMLFAMLGMMIMASAPNFVTMYLGLELMALCTYVLVGFQRDVLRSSEAGLKYFILGSLASGFLLYGISFLYGVTGSFDFATVGSGIAHSGSGARFAVLLGLVFVIAGLAFKISLAPFHMWTPDAYEGAPTPITAFMSVAPKVAGLVILIRVLVDALPSLQVEYITIFSWLAVLSMAVGNLAAIAQRNIKRMLAYSTIGHVGFIMLGVIAGNADGYAGVLVYMTIYLFMSMGAFAVIVLMNREGIQGELLDDFAGLSKVRPGYALAMGLYLFSLAGIPFLGGFWAKYVVFIAAIESGHLYLAIIALLFSVVGAFYYIRVVKYIYFDDQRVEFNFVENRLMQATVAVTAVAVVAIGIFPQPVINICKAALGGII